MNELVPIEKLRKFFFVCDQDISSHEVKKLKTAKMEKNKLFSVRGNILQKSYFLQKKKNLLKNKKFCIL
jgi:hypothetical protein